ncbi:arsenical pump-driving ATPase [Halobacillus litoralis]|uniref:arsenical pump-driving ATPase n=1 Tax=Halobacillus litoralis TaxID=45668 RepID=UPI001CD47926|nr:arsenical pump-driving ATPase [Halobacillus litoralis]MCA1023734.1 arsenical pump-driving ATPase [Halobacillus litoralis]
MHTSYHPRTHVQTPYLFFTGKGGVGKTSVACATAVSLADQGKKVLLVSTDPASNLQDVFNMELTREPAAVPSVSHLYASNIDPEEAARAYREKTVGPYRDKLPESVVNQMEEQLSGACTVEIAAFDEFSHLLADDGIFKDFDHVLFDTAPTGHTLRLLTLPTAWSGYLEESTHGASCLGPLSGLGDKKNMYQKAMDTLSNGEKTTLVMVARPEESTLLEADRASVELGRIGIEHQMLVINGVFQPQDSGDEVASVFYTEQQEALKEIPDALQQIRTYSLPYVPYSLTDIQHMRQIVSESPAAEVEITEESVDVEPLPSLKEVVDDFSAKNTRVIFTMGKGGVGKTSVASAIAVGLTEKGHRVHLTTTDPASHVADMFKDSRVHENLTISSIDPEVEVENYKAEVIANAGELNEDELAYLKEDLDSPCTEEIAVFRAFADVVDSEEEIVVIDTAPTGHTLLLLDSSEAYHKEMSRSTGDIPESVTKLLPRLRNPEETGVVVVTLPEATPVFEAGRLQEDLNRAEITPKWWVINRSLYAAGTKDPVLEARAATEKQWIRKVQNELSAQSALIPWGAAKNAGYEQWKVYIQS